MTMARENQSYPGSKAQHLSPNQFLGWAGPPGASVTMDMDRQFRTTETLFLHSSRGQKSNIKYRQATPPWKVLEGAVLDFSP